MPGETKLDIHYFFPDIIDLSYHETQEHRDDRLKNRRRLLSDLDPYARQHNTHQGTNSLFNQHRQVQDSLYQHGMDAMWQRRHDNFQQHQQKQNHDGVNIHEKKPAGNIDLDVHHNPYERMWNKKKLDGRIQHILDRAGPTGKLEFDKIRYWDGSSTSRPDRTWQSSGSVYTDHDDIDIVLSMHQEPFKHFLDIDPIHLPNRGVVGQRTELIQRKQGVIQYTVPFDGDVFICVQSKSASFARPSRAGLFVERSKDLDKIIDDQTRDVNKSLNVIQQRLAMVRTRVEEITHESNLSKERQQAFHRESARFHSDLVKFPIVHIIMIFLTAGVQMIYIIQYFKRKHLVG